MKLEPSSADTLEYVAVEIPQVMRKGFLSFHSCLLYIPIKDDTVAENWAKN